jgi:hypothetical protein
MANNVDTVNGVAIADIQTINGVTDDNLQALNGLEFTGVIPDSLVLLATATASSSSTLAFASGIDSTYDLYEFHLINLHPQTNSVNLEFQVNAAGASGFNESIVSTYIDTYHAEASSSSGSHDYNGSRDQVGTAYQQLIYEVGSDADQSCSGVLKLYAPSDTTYVKHFVTEVNGTYQGDYTMNAKAAGYISTATAVDEISFKFSSGNIDAGIIKMYGVIK